MPSTFPRTKIVCTLGPSSSSKEKIVQLIQAGMNVARLNFSHGEHAVHAQNVAWIREAEEELGARVAILQDLQGPKIRTGRLKDGGIQLQLGQVVVLRYGVEQCDSTIPIDYRDLASDVEVGARILMDDGLMAMKIVAIEGLDVVAEVTQPGFLKSRKGVNFPDSPLSIPSITEKDMRDLLFGVSQRVDYIALSFVRTAEDVSKLRSILKALGADIPIVAKIEMPSAMTALEGICDVSDAIMVARGDLGVECGFALVSAYQKKIVTAARRAGKPVIVATQMLDSMIENARPTKAEMSDVANAVFDLADATMLSGETASGKHPVLTVETMRRILDRVDHSHKLLRGSLTRATAQAPTEIFASVACDIALLCQADAIVCLTLTGQIAKSIARNRPYTPIIALSPRSDVARRLSLLRGVVSLQNPIFLDTDHALAEVGDMLKKRGLVSPGQLLVITGGIPVSQMRPTNLIKLHRVM